MKRRNKDKSVFKTIGVVVVFGALAFGAAAYTGMIDFHAKANITPKGEKQVKELGNSAADYIRDSVNKATKEN